MNRVPNSKSNLERAISRYAGHNDILTNELSVSLANVIVAQMIGLGVVKGGTSLKLRYGAKMTRFTHDLDTARSSDLNMFLTDIKTKLKAGWQGFTGEVVLLKQANPKGIPFEYVMQPCAVHLSYLGIPWRIVDMEIGHDEIGDADACDLIAAPKEITDLTDFLGFPSLSAIRVMTLEYQIAQKLHGVSEKGSKRAHDLIDLQVICQMNDIDFVRTAEVCRELFRYRKKQPWPPCVVKNENWDILYTTQKGTLPILPSVDEAIIWANDLIQHLC